MGVEALHIELLHACPLACLACDHRLAGNAVLPAAALKEVFASPEFKGLKLVSFSGGEPLLHPELGKIIKKAGASFPAAALVLLTSLYDADRLWPLLRSLPSPLAGRLHIGSSLDGPQQVHDRMRGRPGAFARLAKNHARLKKEFPRLSTGFTFTATRVNAAAFYAAWLEAKELGAPLGVQFLAANANTGGLELDPAAVKALAAGLRRALQEGGPASPEAVNLRQALAFLGGGPTGACGAGSSFLMLAPEGRFYLCPFHKDLTAPLSAPGALRPPAAGYRSRHCVSCFLRCAR